MTAFKKATVLAVLFLAAGTLAAQDFGFGEAEPATTAEASPNKLTLSGQVDFAGRAFVEPSAVGNSKVATPSSVLATIEAGTSAADLRLGLKVSPDILTANPARVLDEAVLRTYLGNWEVVAGLVKLTWGKGDSLRVLDVVNPQDYTDFVNQDTEDRKIAQALAQVTLRTSETGKLEGVYVPFFEANTVPLEGTWAPKAFTDLRQQVRNGFYYGSTPSANGGLGNGAYAAAYNVAFGGLHASAVAAAGGNATAVAGNAATMASLQSQAATIAKAQATSQVDTMVNNVLLLPDTKTLSWGQGGLRYTDSLGGVDLGVQYYTGFLRDPVINSDPALLASTQKLAVHYNRYHQAGLDSALVLADFNVRAEAAWNQTEDWAGDQPLVRNSFANATLGLDRTIAGVSFNVQTLGTWTQSTDKATGAYDIQKGADAFTGTVAAQVAYKFWNDRMEVSLAGSQSYPKYDWVVVPQVTVTPVDDLTLALGGKLFGGDATGQLGQYASKSFVEVKAGYTF